MDISDKLKERFCKDCNIPLRLYKEPYFTLRLILYNKFYNTLNKWNIFVDELKKYNNEQEYFEEYNKVKDAAILSIKDSEAYQQFNTEDMNKFAITHKDLPGKDIFKPSNDGKAFISIDMKKANFSSLKYYGDCIFDSMFNNASTWEEFISTFTENKHIINSKYIRQVILGNCNPKRHITYEKYIMDQVLTSMEEYHMEDRIVFFSNDEIVYDLTNMRESNKLHKLYYVKELTEQKLEEEFTVPFRAELFSLHKIHGTDGYVKRIYNHDDEYTYNFKCFDNYMLPFVLRYFLKEDVKKSDRMFHQNGLLAEFVDIPEIEVDKEILNS